MQALDTSSLLHAVKCRVVLSSRGRSKGRAFDFTIKQLVRPTAELDTETTLHSP